jgi:hypothetical protein
MTANLQTAAKRAEQAIVDNPGLSDRAIAAKIGVSPDAVNRARRMSDCPTSDSSKRVGRDGRSRRVPQRQEVEHMRRPGEDEARRIYEAAAPEAREIFDRYHNSPRKIRDQVWQLIVLANSDDGGRLAPPAPAPRSARAQSLNPFQGTS